MLPESFGLQYSGRNSCFNKAEAGPAWHSFGWTHHVDALRPSQIEGHE